jgi:hypothetical protein
MSQSFVHDVKLFGISMLYPNEFNASPQDSEGLSHKPSQHWGLAGALNP